MEVSEILNKIPTSLTDKLAKETGVDHSVQRLRGRVMLDLLLFGMIRSERSSTHVLEKLYGTKLFEAFSSKDKDHQTRHSSIAERLKVISPDYFKAIFEWSFDFFFKDYGGSKTLQKLTRFDSTMIKISSALVDWGMRVGRKPKDSPRKVQLKVTLGFKGMFPKVVNIHHEQKYLSEENALKKIILENGSKSNEIISFDLGLKSRESLKEIDGQRIKFVTRGGDNLRYEVIKSKEKLPKKQNGLRFIQDSTVHLYSDGHEVVAHEFRLIEVEDIETQKRLYFITNIIHLSAVQIAEIYRQRWDIEVFFRFIKQELNIKHLLSHSLNGIKVQIYVTLTLAILLTVFKMSNNLKGYKLPKIEFEDQLLFYIFAQLKLGEQMVLNDNRPET